MWQCWGEWCFCFPPPLLPPKTWGMPKPLCNLEGIFILPQGQHVFFPGSPTAQAAQSEKKKKTNQTSPERTAWSDRQLLQKNKSLQTSKAVSHQQQKIQALTFWPSNYINTNPKPHQHRRDRRAMEQRRAMWKHATGLESPEKRYF